MAGLQQTVSSVNDDTENGTNQQSALSIIHDVSFCFINNTHLHGHAHDE
jgi:hypothetical protein